MEFIININLSFPRNRESTLKKSHSSILPFNFVITVCDDAKEIGSEEDILFTFRNVRNKIKQEFKKFYKKIQEEVK